MNLQEKNFAEQIILNSKEHRLRQIQYAEKRRGTDDYELDIWSTNSYTGAFYGTGIIPILEKYFFAFVRWNSVKERCELRIFDNIK